MDRRHNKENEEHLKLIETQFHVALSFAGEDREYVERVADTLTEMGIKVFYDKYERISLWGKNLLDHLIDVYKNKAKYTIIFISKHYAEKIWTNAERKAAQAKAFQESSDCILPARFDDTEIPGILLTIGYINLNEYSPEEFAEIVKKKVGPIQRKEFLPHKLDFLYEEVGADTPEFQEEIDILAGHFFHALSLMTSEERWLLVDIINNTCPAGPPDNVHVDIEYLERTTNLEKEEIISCLDRLNCLGFKTELKKELTEDGRIHKHIDALYVEYYPLAKESQIENATFIAIAIIKIIFECLCPECRKHAINVLDFSILSKKTGFPETQPVKK